MLKHVPPIAAAQKLAHVQLGLAKNQHVESSDFEAYLKVFLDGFTEGQIRMIKDLFSGIVPDDFLADGMES
jgi:hypothetical protein